MAQTLRLDDDDRDLVFRLAGHEPPQAERIAMVVRPSVLLDRMADLPVELRRGSPRFDELWREGRSSPWRTATKSIRHPSLGTISLDCDTVLMPDGHQTVLVYSADPGSPEAAVLDMLRVIGLQQV